MTRKTTDGASRILIRAMAALLGVVTLANCAADSPEPPPSSSTTPVPRPTWTPPPTYPLTPEQFPRWDGSTATMPLAALVLERMTGLDTTSAENAVTFTGTSSAHLRLANGETDIIIAYEPDDETKHQLAQHGVELEYYPLGRDALVFLVNASNPVTGLTTAQLHDIYRRGSRITNWNQLGGADAALVAFQRNETSGSQALFRKLIMGDTPLADAPTELVVDMMRGLIDRIASYHNTGAALGYSVYYYARYMYAQPGVKLLAVDGVEPSSETIAAGTYPHLNDFYVAIRASEPTHSPVRVVLGWLLSADGATTIADAGYVGIR
ncbi:MAG: substrate-binding domain-containing protein [Propionibacteriaceae bacterium]|jgi:phosphate transport system substrate-binding protein|nr:substrate-binding domain-containing protein [Propionibacteriaceae bacterium]